MIAQKKARRFQAVIYDGKNQELIETIYQAYYLQNSNIDFSRLETGVYFLFKKKFVITSQKEFEKKYEITEASVQNPARKDYKDRTLPVEMTLEHYADSPLAKLDEVAMKVVRTGIRHCEVCNVQLPRLGESSICNMCQTLKNAKSNLGDLTLCQKADGLRKCERPKNHHGCCAYNPSTLDKTTESHKDALNQEIMNKAVPFALDLSKIQNLTNQKTDERFGTASASGVASAVSHILEAEQKKWPVKEMEVEHKFLSMPCFTKEEQEELKASCTTVRIDPLKKDGSAEPYQVFMPVVTEDIALLEKENQTIETAKRQDKEMQHGEPVEEAGPAALDMVLKSELPEYVHVNLEEVYPKAVVPKGLDPYAWLEQKENEATVLSVKGVPLVTLLPGQHVIFERYSGGLKMDVRNSHEVESSNFLKSITIQDAANIRGNVTVGKKLPEYDENLPQAYPVTY